MAVTRKYITKSGEIRIYTYNKNYNKKGSLNFVVYNKNGKLTKKGEAFVNSIVNDEKAIDNILRLSNNDTNVLRASFDAKQRYIKEIFNKVVANKLAKNQKTKASSIMSTMISKAKEDRLTKMIYNFGYSPDELAIKIGVSRGELLDEANWDFVNNTFMNKFAVEYSYEDGFSFSKI